jgi:hypothetical protein
MGLKHSLQTTVQVTDNPGLEKEGQTWEHYCGTTGGKLELSKCLYYLLFYTFDDDGTLHGKANMEGTSNLTSGLSPVQNPIDHRDNSQAHRTLGIWPTPAHSKQYVEALPRANDSRVDASKRHDSLKRPPPTGQCGFPALLLLLDHNES